MRKGYLYNEANHKLTDTVTDIDMLLERCAKGDQRAQLAVYKRYQHAMFNTAYRIVKQRAAAEDVMQESFISAFDKLHTFAGSATFGSWLKRIVVNNSLSFYQRQQRLGEVPIEPEVPVVEHQDTAPCDEAKKKVKRVMQALGKLKENYRLALTLHLIEGYDYEEVAGIMHLSNGNCRTLISRAKASLRDKLDV